MNITSFLIATSFMSFFAVFLAILPLFDKSEDMKRNKDVPIRESKSKMWICLFVYVTLMISTIFADFPNISFSTIAILSGIFFLLGLLYVCGYINSRIILGDEYFSYRNFLRKTYKIPYESIRQYKTAGLFIHIETNERKFCFFRLTMVGIDDLLENLELHVYGVKKEGIKLSNAERNIYYSILMFCLAINLLLAKPYLLFSGRATSELWVELIAGVCFLGTAMIALFFEHVFGNTYYIFFKENGFTKGLRKNVTVLYIDIARCQVGKFFIILYVGKTKYRFFKAKMLHDELVRHGVV